MVDLTACFEPVREISRSADLPGVVESLSYGTPALKVRGKLIVRMKEPDVLVLPCDLDEKQMLMAAAPEIYFEEPHYFGWPAVLVRLSAISPEELRDRIEKCWRALAGRNLIKVLEGRTSNSGSD